MNRMSFGLPKKAIAIDTMYITLNPPKGNSCLQTLAKERLILTLNLWIKGMDSLLLISQGKALMS